MGGCVCVQSQWLPLCIGSNQCRAVTLGVMQPTDHGHSKISPSPSTVDSGSSAFGLLDEEERLRAGLVRGSDSSFATFSFFSFLVMATTAAASFSDDVVEDEDEVVRRLRLLSELTGAVLTATLSMALLVLVTLPMAGASAGGSAASMSSASANLLVGLGARALRRWIGDSGRLATLSTLSTLTTGTGTGSGAGATCTCKGGCQRKGRGRKSSRGEKAICFQTSRAVTGQKGLKSIG